ncbi:heavy metal translocatin [Mycena filopes]|nr:heavy metal translocatin [Mycena filopes]
MASYRFHPAMPSPLGDKSTTVHVSNLHCGSCVITIQQALALLQPPPISVEVSIVSQTVTVHHLAPLSSDDIHNAILDAGFDVDLPQVDPSEHAADAQGTHLQQEGFSDVVVSLLESSATALITRKELADVAVESVEDCGFDAHIMSVDPVGPRPPGETSRTISLRVDIVPMKAMAALEALGPRVVVTTPLTSHTDPIVTLSYEPDAPTFTIRTIIATLESSNSPPFEVAIYRPPSLEERHYSRWLVAIPTFIIGIVYMSLVKEGNPGKDYLMAPMWTCAGLFHRRSIKEIRALWKRGSKTPVFQRFFRFGSMNLLVSTGVSVAFFASGDTTTYFDSVIFLSLFLLAGRYLEAYSKARTSDAITALAGLRPVEAQLVVARDSFKEKPEDYDPEKAESDAELDGSHRNKNCEDYSRLSGVRCNTGSTPAADGTIVGPSQKSTFTFDESMLTGESMPVTKQLGDKVFLGSINRGQSVHVRVDTIGGGWTISSRFYFVPVITLLAILTWILWLILAYTGVLPADYLDIEIGGWTVWSLEFAIAVFVVACPCGIALAAPTALLVGSGLAAKYGILARGGGEAFQEMERVDVVVFDKTGTLTVGEEPRVSDCEFNPESRWKKEVLLGIATELESASSHPLAIAIHHFCAGNGAIEQSGSEFKETAGLGIGAKFAAGAAIIGSQAFMQQNGVVVDESTSELVQTWKSEAKSVVFFAVSDSDQFSEVAAVFAVTDPIREEAPAVIAWFAKQGISTWMISGDNITTASAVAKMVGIPNSNVIAGVLPHEKGEKIQMLQNSGPKRPKSFWRSFGGRPQTNRSAVAMVGDGINDAVALTVADVGIAIGSGSDVAISSASFILLSSDLRALITLCDLSRSIMRRVRLNFIWATFYNLAALPVAAGAIYPAGHIRLNPVWASLAMALSSVSVVCSSLALKLYRAPKFP